MRLRTAVLLVALAPLLLAGLIRAAVPAAAATAGSEAVLSGLTDVTALAVAPDGRVLVGEQGSGIIRIYDPSTNTSSVFYRVPRNQQLIGITVHWAFPATPYVYGYGLRLDSANRTRMQLYRIRGAATPSGFVGTGLTVLRDLGGLPADHYGGHLAFGPDHQLYLSVGDGGLPAQAQQLGLVRGKILRMTATAGVPTGNPFGNRVWAYGTRNVYGFAFDPTTHRLWAADNGPECNDELDLIARGANYGWGGTAACTSPPTVASTNRDGPSPVLPKAIYPTPVAPTGVAFCQGCGLDPSVEGTLVYGTYVTGQLRRVVLDSTRTAVVSEDVLLQHSSGIVGLERAPNGVLWFIDRTSLRRVVPQQPSQ